MFCNGSEVVTWYVHSSLPVLFGSAACGAGIAPTWLGSLAALGAICAVAVTIRLMDDFLDVGLDDDSGLCTTAAWLREATLPYALAAFACSAALVPKLSVSLFAASYAVGMVGDHNRLLPLRLHGWQEGLLMVLLGVLSSGASTMAWAMCLIIAIQAYDDFIDRHSDTRAGSRNLCHRYGVGEVALAGVSALFASLILSPLLTVQGGVALAFTHLVAPRSEKQGGIIDG